MRNDAPSSLSIFLMVAAVAATAVDAVAAVVDFMLLADAAVVGCLRKYLLNKNYIFLCTIHTSLLKCREKFVRMKSLRWTQESQRS